MTSRIHSIAPRVAIAVAIVLVPVLVGGYLRSNQPYAVPAGTDIFAALQGKWAWTTSDSGCATDPHTIAFAPDHKVMTITAARPYRRPDGTFDSVAVYDIHAHTRSWIRGAIRGETRMADDGRPVVWDLVLKSPDRYAWHRTDWHRRGHTREIQRCLSGIP